MADHLEHEQLWTQIRGLAIGPVDAQLTFERRLARENGWSIPFAERVVAEYKRFLLLAAVSDQPLTPSDQIDQAWHLHLSYTESYWTDLCRGILGRPLHHGPTRGGHPEGRKFARWYERTLEFYESVFGESPPLDIWPRPDERFRDAASFQRVNRATHLLVRWPRILRGSRGRAILALLTFGVLCWFLVLVGFTFPEILASFGVILVAVSIGSLLRTGSRSARRRSARSGVAGGAAGGACGGCGRDAGCGGCGGGGCGGCGA